MQQLDEQIFEYLDREEWGTPTMLAQAEQITASQDRIAERCKMLQYAGMIAPILDEMYELTTNGVLYLNEEIDARHQPWLTVDRVLRG